jgi:hypothetical protein
MGKLGFKAIKSRFRATSIWPFNPWHRTTKTWTSKIYIATNIIDHGSVDDYTTYEKADHNQNLGEEFVAL